MISLFSRFFPGHTRSSTKQNRTAPICLQVTTRSLMLRPLFLKEAVQKGDASWDTCELCCGEPPFLALQPNTAFSPGVCQEGTPPFRWCCYLHDPQHPEVWFGSPRTQPGCQTTPHCPEAAWQEQLEVMSLRQSWSSSSQGGRARWEPPAVEDRE